MSDAPKQKQTLRLALRCEGDWWVAYAAKPGTMDGAVEIGRIGMGVVQDRRRKDAFMDICLTFLADLINAATGSDIENWLFRPAPEHERAGRA